MQLVLNTIEKVLQLANFKSFTKKAIFFSNFTDEKHFMIDEKYSSN